LRICNSRAGSFLLFADLQFADPNSHNFWKSANALIQKRRGNPGPYDRSRSTKGYKQRTIYVLLMEISHHTGIFSDRFPIPTAGIFPTCRNCKEKKYVLFGTDPDRNRVTWETPSSEAIPCRRKPLRRTRLLRDPAQTQV
jgi:hypothetical protein